MSPHVGNFVQDLVEMAKATEELPQVRQELRHAEHELSQARDTIASREIHILQLKQDIDNLNSQLHQAEVAKDAAETMFLEADDRTTRALEFIKTLFGNAGALIQALEPAKPTEPVKAETKSEYYDDFGAKLTEPMPKVEMPPAPVPVPQDRSGDIPNWAGPNVSPERQRAPDPTTASATSSAGSSIGEAGQSEVNPTGVHTQDLKSSDALSVDTYASTVEHGPTETKASGQSATHPIADASPVAENTSATASNPSGSAKQPEPGPYTGTLYYDYPNYVSLNQWLAGGGTEADYHWRPSTNEMSF